MDERLLACIHCGFCLPACPTYNVLGDEADSPRGRLHLMRAVAEGRLEASDPSYQVHIDRCLGCRACEPVCPAGVPYGALLEEAREDIGAHRPPTGLSRGLLAVFGRRGLARMAGWAGRILRATGLPAVVARRLPDTERLHGLRAGLAMLEASSPWPELRRLGLASGETESKGAEEEPSSDGKVSRGSVVILDGCVQAGLFARVGAATRRTLEANGYSVQSGSRGAGCCGALHAHAGVLDDARGAARRHIAAFEASGADFMVVDAAGCGAAMKGYGELLSADDAWAERAHAFTEAVRDVSELLSEAGPRRGGPVVLRAAYDPPCHLKHAQGVHDSVLDVLAAVPKLELAWVRDADQCCGGAGIYGITHRELGGAVADAKVQALRETGASVVLTGNPGCMMQIGSGLLLEDAGVGVVHPVELLDESYRRGGIYD